MLVPRHQLRSLSTRHFHWDDLVGKGSSFPGESRSPLAFHSVTILLLATDSVLARDILGGDTHMTVVESIGKTVCKQKVDQHSMPQPITEASAGKKVRRLRHAFHATRDGDLGFAERDSLCRHDDCPQS
jgi:hypothetical protein